MFTEVRISSVVVVVPPPPFEWRCLWLHSPFLLLGGAVWPPPWVVLLFSALLGWCCSLPPFPFWWGCLASTTSGAGWCVSVVVGWLVGWLVGVCACACMWGVCFLFFINFQVFRSFKVFKKNVFFQKLTASLF